MTRTPLLSLMMYLPAILFCRRYNGAAPLDTSVAGAAKTAGMIDKSTDRSISVALVGLLSQIKDFDIPIGDLI